MTGFGMDVRADFKAVERMIGAIDKRIVPKAGARALNKTIKVAEKAAAKDIAVDIGKTQKFVRQRLKIEEAKKDKLFVMLLAKGSRIPIYQMGAKQVGRRKNLRDKKTGRFKERKPSVSKVKRGVTYKGRGGKSVYIPGAFIATMKSGHVGVFKREGAARLPIQELYGPSIPYAFTREKISRAMRMASLERWPKLFNHEISYELRKYR